MQNLKPGHRAPTVCLDAGHYGKYNPSPVVPGYYESDMNWTLHLLLKSELERRGIAVITTRPDQDTDLPLVERGKAARDADLFLSLHSNAASTEQPDWVVAMHFVDDDCGPIDHQSKELAGLLAQKVAQIMGVGHQIYTQQSAKDRDGNGYKDDYYGVLRGAHRVATPGVIIEHGFHTNVANTRWLMNQSNLERLAQAEAELIAQWFCMTENTVTIHLPMLEKGHKVSAVQTLQALLVGRGYDCGPSGIDGSFGGATAKALRRFQADHSISPTAVTDAQTWETLLIP